MVDRSYIYPKIKYIETLLPENRVGVTLVTYLRKEHTPSKYYLQPIVHHMMFDAITSDNRNLILNEFNEMVYKAILFGKVDPDIVNLYGVPIFKKDHDSSTEIERLYGNAL